MANGIERTREFQIAHQKVQEEKRRQDEALQKEPPLNFREIHAGEAFNLGFSSTQAMNEEIKKHPKVFSEIAGLAIKKIESYEEAEAELRNPIDPNLIGKIKKYQNLKARSQEHAKEPGPPKIYDNRHKSRRAKTKGVVIKMFEIWRERTAKADEIINMERATPLDEYPEFIR